MHDQKEIEVSALDFQEAVCRLPAMKRSPRGVRGNIPKDTLLSPDPEGVFVQTPVMSTLVIGTQSWATEISVDAWRLAELTKTLKKLGATIQSDKLGLSVAGKELLIRFNKTKLHLPAYEPK
ncbi:MULTISPECIES: hypothetical protein [Roseibium]|uniref:Uncharacterized protein n=1 Tax=Roseibium aggregatum TaxID=187304 RepID=A0A0M6Y5F2_9HYPH|nr:hypothetical protein [Roseibium aggregatum]CTQ45312.1 hypothetical protein LAL4801_03762 [Roseibium aggregatum]